MGQGNISDGDVAWVEPGGNYEMRRGANWQTGLWLGEDVNVGRFSEKLMDRWVSKWDGPGHR